MRYSPFQMKILVHDPYISQERAEKAGVELVELKDLLGKIFLRTPIGININVMFGHTV